MVSVIACSILLYLDKLPNGLIPSASEILVRHFPHCSVSNACWMWMRDWVLPPEESDVGIHPIVVVRFARSFLPIISHHSCGIFAQPLRFQEGAHGVRVFSLKVSFSSFFILAPSYPSSSSTSTTTTTTTTTTTPPPTTTTAAAKDVSKFCVACVFFRPFSSAQDGTYWLL